jgi:hypothetical protein
MALVREAAIILNNLLRITDNGWSSSFRFRPDCNNYSPIKERYTVQIVWNGLCNVMWVRYYGFSCRGSLHIWFILGNVDGSDTTLKTEPYYKSVYY